MQKVHEPKIIKIKVTDQPDEMHVFVNRRLPIDFVIPGYSPFIRGDRVKIDLGDFRESETLPLDEDGDPRPLTFDEKHYQPANEDELFQDD